MQIRALPQARKYIDGLATNVRAAVRADLDDLEMHGLGAPLVSLRQIKGKLWEIRTDNVRLFYVMVDRETMVLLHGYRKQGKKAPQREIETALQRMKGLLEGE